MFHMLSIITILLAFSTNLFSAQVSEQKPSALTCINIIYVQDSNQGHNGKTYNNVPVSLFSVPGQKNKARMVMIGIDLKNSLHKHFEKEGLILSAFNSKDFTVMYNDRLLNDNDTSECCQNFAYVSGPRLRNSNK